MRGSSPSLRLVSAALARPAETLRHARALAGTHGVLAASYKKLSEADRLERAAELARRAAAECLELERLLLERREAVSL